MISLINLCDVIMIISLENKNAIVCGSTRGIGRAIAFELAKSKAHITLIARNEEKLLQLIKELPNDSNRPHNYICVDFNNPEELRTKLTKYTPNNPPVHILINNSGGPKSGPIVEAKIEEFQQALTSHLFCNHILAQAFIPGMKSEAYGRIINVVSTSVRQPLNNLGVSNTTRAAVSGWAKTLANELAPYKITVNNILPGPTRTDRLIEILETRRKKSNMTLEEAEIDYIKDVPVGRTAEPEEIAYATVFLASEQASYITGHSLPVDGGRIKSL